MERCQNMIYLVESINIPNKVNLSSVEIYIEKDWCIHLNLGDEISILREELSNCCGCLLQL